jgi:hypothetical protein
MRIADLPYEPVVDGAEHVVILKGGRAKRTSLSGLLNQAGSALLTVLGFAGAGPHALDRIEHAGRRLRIGADEAAATIAVVLPADADVGTVFLPRQTGAGALKFVPAPGATLTHRLGHNGTAGRWAGASLTCETNEGGQAAAWYLDGDTAVVA